MVTNSCVRSRPRELIQRAFEPLRWSLETRPSAQAAGQRRSRRLLTNLRHFPNDVVTTVFVHIEPLGTDRRMIMDAPFLPTQRHPQR